jgi:hypothetical protein
MIWLSENGTSSRRTSSDCVRENSTSDDHHFPGGLLCATYVTNQMFDFMFVFVDNAFHGVANTDYTNELIAFDYR